MFELAANLSLKRQVSSTPIFPMMDLLSIHANNPMVKNLLTYSGDVTVSAKIYPNSGASNMNRSFWPNAHSPRQLTINIIRLFSGIRYGLTATLRAQHFTKKNEQKKAKKTQKNK